MKSVVDSFESFEILYKDRSDIVFVFMIEYSDSLERDVPIIGVKTTPIYDLKSKMGVVDRTDVKILSWLRILANGLELDLIKHKSSSYLRVFKKNLDFTIPETRKKFNEFIKLCKEIQKGEKS